MSVDEPTDFQSSYSFGVALSKLLDELPDLAAGRLYVLATDPTAGLRSVAPRAVRDESIRALAKVFGSPARIHAALNGYATSSYPLEHENGPGPGASATRRLLWRVLTFSGGAVISDRQIRTIINRSR